MCSNSTRRRRLGAPSGSRWRRLSTCSWDFNRPRSRSRRDRASCCQTRSQTSRTRVRFWNEVRVARENLRPEAPWLDARPTPTSGAPLTTRSTRRTLRASPPGASPSDLRRDSGTPRRSGGSQGRDLDPATTAAPNRRGRRERGRSLKPAVPPRRNACAIFDATSTHTPTLWTMSTSRGRSAVAEHNASPHSFGVRGCPRRCPFLEHCAVFR